MTMKTLRPLDHERTLQEGVRLWLQAETKPPEFSDVIWCLLEEAAETQRTLRSPRPSADVTYWPETVYTSAELVGAANEQLSEARAAAKEGRSPEPVWTPQGGGHVGASAAALRRYDVVTTWPRFIRARTQKALRMELLIALASGLSLAGAARADRFLPLGYSGRSGVAAFRQRSLEAIEHELTAMLPNFRVSAYAA